MAIHEGNHAHRGSSGSTFEYALGFAPTGGKEAQGPEAYYREMKALAAPSWAPLVLFSAMGPALEWQILEGQTTGLRVLTA